MLMDSVDHEPGRGKMGRAWLCSTMSRASVGRRLVLASGATQHHSHCVGFHCVLLRQSQSPAQVQGEGKCTLLLDGEWQGSERAFETENIAVAIF